MLLPLFFRFVQRKEKHENALNRRIILRMKAQKSVLWNKREIERKWRITRTKTKTVMKLKNIKSKSICYGSLFATYLIIALEFSQLEKLDAEASTQQLFFRFILRPLVF